ncbi:MAG: hypothetical protein Q8P24_19630 [Desulfobacterales bacterium]|nr:hypothetical protein [Desulfobacterales bacterium]
MNALKKIEQAKYHLDLMKELPPNEDAFLFNLVSFISSAREVTWYLQKEFCNNPKFKDWYTVGSCWAHPSTQPTAIIVPGGVVTIAPDQIAAKTSVNTILRRTDYKTEYFFEKQ